MENKKLIKKVHVVHVTTWQKVFEKNGVGDMMEASNKYLIWEFSKQSWLYWYYKVVE